MIDGPTVIRAIENAGFSHVVWLPDSHLGTWEDALKASSLGIVRPTREGEAVAVAAGLLLGGARPLVAIQVTGFFEACDAIRNVAHDLALPVKMLVGVRGWRAHQTGSTSDNCPRFAEPVARALDLDVTWVNPFVDPPPDCTATFSQLASATRAAVLFWGE